MQPQVLNALLYMSPAIFVIYNILAFINNFFKEIRKQFNFLIDFKNKKIFELNFTDLLQEMMKRGSLKHNFIFSHLFKVILFNKWRKYYIKQIHFEPKLLSAVNLSLERVFCFESSDKFKKKIMKFILNDRNIFINEIDNFDKFEKGYIIEKFFKFIPQTRENRSFINKINEIIFEKLALNAFKTKKVSMELLSILDMDQKKRVELFV